MTECGLAALAILLAHHRQPVSLESLREAAGSTRLGTTARVLIQLARRHGMDARAFRTEPEKLAALGFPLIVHSRFIHFLVVEGMTGSEVRVNDPGLGPRIIPMEIFAEDFTGIAITVRPPADAARSSRQRGWAGQILERLAPYRSRVLTVLALAAATQAAGLAAALAAGQLVDGQAGWALFLVLAAVTALAAAWLRDRVSEHLAARLAGDVAATGLMRLLGLPSLWFARRSPDQVAQAPMAAVKMQTHLGAVLAVAELPILLIPAVAAVILDPLAGGVVVATALASLAVLCGVYGRRGGVVARLGAGGRGRTLPEPGIIAAIHTSKTGGGEAELFTMLAGRHAAQLAETQQAAGTHALVGAMLTGLAAAGLAAALGLGWLGVTEGYLTAGGVAVLALLSVALHFPLARLDRQLPGLHELRATLARLRDMETSLPSSESVPVGPRPTGCLVLEGVSFRPSPLLGPVLSGVSLTAEPGTQIGIVGPSGSGKTVLAKMACGLLEPDAGSVLLGGEPVGLVAQRHPGAVAWVDAANSLHRGSVADILRCGSTAYPDDALWEMLDLVGLAGDLAPRGGLGLELVRGGAELSGGQRRRLMLARSLLRRPALLVLDETLDSLEPELDRTIRSRLRRLGCTVLITSGRPWNLGECEQVIDLGRLHTEETAS